MKHTQRKRILAVVLALALLCTSSPFTQLPSIHAAETGQHTLWYHITAHITSSWAGHIAGEITLTNTDSQTRSGWQILLPWQAKITSLWNGSCQATEQGYLIRAMEYNSDIAPGSSITIGFLAEGEDAGLQTLVSEHFFTQDGVEITDARDRAAMPPEPQENPAPAMKDSQDPASFSEPVVAEDTEAANLPGETTFTDPMEPPAAESETGSADVPIGNPTDEPTGNPTNEPAGNPTDGLIGNPTDEPTGNPTNEPAGNPTDVPIGNPTDEPTEKLTDEPTENPTDGPIENPTGGPTETEKPAATATPIPEIMPSAHPTATPTPDYPDHYLTSDITLQEDTSYGNLYLLEGGSIYLNGYTLSIQGNLWIQAGSNGIQGRGSIQLKGSLVQSEQSQILRLENDVKFILCGDQTQNIQPAHPEQARLGQLDLSGCKEAFLPEEIHCYTLSGIRNLRMGEKLRLAADYCTLDGDINLPGNLELLTGEYRTGGHQITIGGGLLLPEQGNPMLYVQQNSTLQVQGDIEIQGGEMEISKAEVAVAGNTTAQAGKICLREGALHMGGSLAVYENAGIGMWGGLLEIKGDWENRNTGIGGIYQWGTIELYGNLRQQENTLEVDRQIILRLKGEQPQQFILPHPEQTSLGQLDLSSCKEACLPEEIHCYTLSGIRNLRMGKKLRLAAEYCTLDGDIYVPGNLELLNGIYRTDGHRLTVAGDLLLDERNLMLYAEKNSRVQVQGNTEILNGGIDITKAEMAVAGNVLAETGNIRLQDGTFCAGANLVVRENAQIAMWGGLLEIGGDWENRSTGLGGLYQQGTIELNGDLLQDKNALDMNRQMFFILKGESPQHIRLAHPLETSLGNLDFSNSAGVTFDTEETPEEEILYLTGNSLKSLEKLQNKGSLDLEFETISLEGSLDYNGSMECHGTFELNQHDLTVHGDLETDSSINNPGVLDIHGNCTLTGGTANPGTGTIRVRKNLRLQDDAALSITEPAGKLLVEGDCKTSASGISDFRAGILELKGDLTQTVASSDYSLRQNGTSVLFSGTEKQTVTLEREGQYTHFRSLDLRESAGVTFTGGSLHADSIIGWDRIDNEYLAVQNAHFVQQRHEIFHGALTLINATFDSSGLVFRVEKDLELSDTELILNQGILRTDGDFQMSGNSTLLMKNEKDQFVVRGDFRTTSAYSHDGLLHAGRLELHGNFYQGGNGASFKATDQHLTVFAGETRQGVHFEDREHSTFAKVIVSGAGYYTDDKLGTKISGVCENIMLGMKDGLEQLVEASVAGLPMAIALGIVAEASGVGSILVVGASVVFAGMLVADTIITADGTGNMYQKARQFGRNIILFLPNLLSIKEIPNVAGEVETLANTPQNVAAALQKLGDLKTYRRLLQHMKDALRDEAGHINLSANFRNLGKLRSALSKADTAEDAIRCCQEIFEEKIFQEILQEHGAKDLGVAAKYMENLISAAEQAGRRLSKVEVDYITWSCDRGIPPKTFLADVFLDRSTKPSGKPGGKPKGKYALETDDGYRGENHAANVLADEGYDVEMLEILKDGNGYGIKSNSNPDFLVEGRVFDAYTPGKDPKLDTIKREISGKTKEQTQYIVIVLDYYKKDVGELKNYLLHQTKYDLKYLRELKALVDGKLETWFVR